MPDVYRVQNHPLLCDVEHVRNVYVGYTGTDKKAVKTALDFEKALKCPGGGVVEWEAEGLLQLRAGDYFFLRDPEVSEEAKDNVLAVMITGRLHHEDVVDAHEAATQAILGARGARTASSTAFERTGCARKIREKRCYSIGAAVQLSRRVVAPSASLDQNRRGIKQYQTMVGDLISSTSAMLLNVQKALPEGCLEAFAANSELTGQPAVGKENVYGTSSIQINISAAGLTASDNRLGDQLGDFGCEHYDSRDSPDHLTTMFANPDIPDDYDPGSFHILQLGVFAVLSKYVGITFSGQRRHVGTAPTPPVGSTAEQSAYRCNVVCYPKDAAVDGLSRFTLASLPGKKARPQSSKALKKRHARKSIKSGEGKGKSNQKGGGKGRAKDRGKGREIVDSDDDAEDPNEDEDESEEDDDGDGDDYVLGARRGSRNSRGRGTDKKGRQIQSTQGGESKVSAEPLYITPEMINISNAGFVPATTNRATFARSGHVIMNRELHVTFMGRSLLQLHAYVLRQLPPQYILSIDSKKMLESISYEDEEGNRVHLSAWPSAPNVNTVSEVRKQNQKVWAEYQEKVRRFIPRIAARAFTYEEGWEDEEGGDGGGAGEDGEGEDGEGEDGEGEDGGGEDGEGEDGEGEVGEGEVGGVEDGQGDSVKGIGTSDSFDSDSWEEALVTAALFDSPFSQSGGHDVGMPAESSHTFRHVQITPEDDPSPLSPPSLGQSIDDRKITAKRILPVGYTEQETLNKRPRIEAFPTTTPATFPFLQLLTAEVLRADAQEVYSDFRTVFASALADERTDFNNRELIAGYQDLLQNPLASSAPGRIRQIHTQTRAHGVSSALKAIEARWERFSVLVSSVHVWYWLDVIIKKRVEELFRCGTVESDRHWLTLLVSLTRTALQTKSDPITLNPFQHLSLMTLRSGLITVPNRYKRSYFTEDLHNQAALLAALTSTVQRILMDCLEYPPETDLKVRRRAWLMGTLSEVLGPEFLATRYAWNAWTSFIVKDFLGETSQSYGKNSDLIKPFRACLEAHSICEAGSATWEAYQSFKQCFQDPSQFHTSQSTPGSPIPAPGLSSRLSNGPGDESSVPTTTQFDLLDGYLRGCLEYGKGTISAESPLHRFIQEQPDSRFPFREKAPGRMRIKGTGSPYHPSVIRTNAGIYSAVIYRGITFNTDFSRHPEYPMIFENFEDWSTKIASFKAQNPSVSLSKNFFCRPDAYGQRSIKGRGVKNANVFWRDVEAMGWPEKSKRVMKFKECFDLFRNDAFPSMGDLCCYLLACDLHYAGVCQAPTIVDVTSFMRSARGGSYHILPALGYGTAAVHPAKQIVVDALSVIEAHLRETFSEEDRGSMGFDLICVEHILSMLPLHYTFQ